MSEKCNEIVLRFAPLMFLFMLLASCYHKELCYYHPHVAPVKISVDWEKANGNDIEGMTAFLFSTQEMEQRIKTTVTTHKIDEIEFDLLEGNYSVAVFNGTPEEYNTLKFYDLTDYYNASVQVSETDVPWYSKYNVKSNDKFVANEPEWIARGISPNINVTKAMVDTAEVEYLRNNLSMSARTVTLVDEVVPDSLSRTLRINVTVKGIDNFYQARAVVSGLAIGKRINTGDIMSETVSHYIGLGNWRRTNDKLSPDGTGEIESTIKCFGLPGGHSGHENENMLTIEILLVDRQTIITSEPIPVGHLMRKDTLLNLYLEKPVHFPVELPYVKPEDGKDSGFGVELEDWEREEIDIL